MKTTLLAIISLLPIYSLTAASEKATPGEFGNYWASRLGSFGWRVEPEPQLERIDDLSVGGLEVSRISFHTVTGKVYGILTVPVDKSAAPFPVEIRTPPDGPGINTQWTPRYLDRITLELSLYDYPIAEHQDANRLEYDRVADQPPRYIPWILGANSAVDWLLERRDADLSRVKACGIGTGGALAIALAAVNGSIGTVDAVDPAFRDLDRLPSEEAKFLDLELFRGKLKPARTSGEFGKGYLLLDRFYFPPNGRIDFTAKGFADARISLIRIADGERIYSGNGGPVGTIDLSACGDRVREGDYRLLVEKGDRSVSRMVVIRREPSERRLTVGSLALYSGDRRLFAAEVDGVKDTPVFPVVLCNRMDRDFTVRDVLYSHYERGDTRAFTYDISEPLCGAETVLREFPRSALTLYRLAYEAQYKMATLDQPGRRIEIVRDNAAFLRGIYGQLKAKYPDRLFAVHLDGFKDAAGFLAAADVLEGAYPSCSYSPDPVPQLKNAFDATLGAADGKPLVFWLGASVPDHGKRRIADELRLGTVYAVLRGAAGMTYHLGHGSIPLRRERMWDLMLRAGAETAKWYPDWVRGTPVEAVTAADPGIVAAIRSTSRGPMILAVNLSDHTASFTVRLSGIDRILTLPRYGSLIFSAEF